MAVFNHPKFGTIRAMAIDGDAWLAGVDVAEALGYRHPKAALLKYVDENDRRLIRRSDGAPFAVPCDALRLINECGVHALIHHSEHPKAKKFIMNEVVSSVRRTAAAMPPVEKAEQIEHPSHYNTSVECIDLIEQTQGIEAAQGFCIGNALKYIYRHRQKNGVEDIKKAAWYLERYIESAEKE